MGLMPQRLKDVHQWLRVNAPLVRLQLISVVEHAKEVFELLDRVQVSTSATLLHGSPQNRRKSQMPRVYNPVFSQHCVTGIGEQEHCPQTLLHHL